MKTFRRFSNGFLTALVCGLTAATVLLLTFVLFFIVKEALPLFETVGVSDFLSGQKWMPVDYTGVTSFGIFNFIAATVYVSLTGLVLAAGILLAVMLLPYLVSSSSDTMLKEREKYLEASKALGISDWYAAATMILPAAMPNILMSMVLAVGRAIADDVVFFQNGRLVETKDAETFWEKSECEETKEFLKG